MKGFTIFGRRLRRSDVFVVAGVLALMMIVAGLAGVGIRRQQSVIGETAELAEQALARSEVVEKVVRRVNILTERVAELDGGSEPAPIRTVTVPERATATATATVSAAPVAAPTVTTTVTMLPEPPACLDVPVVGCVPVGMSVGMLGLFVLAGGGYTLVVLGDRRKA